MPKGGQDVRGRLQRSALELFGEHGYDQTTSAEIAARAGVTERTFFRHFPDKREVLFDGQARLSSALIEGIAASDAARGPLQTLLTAFQTVTPMIEANRPFAEPRQHVIASHLDLQERELAKHAALTVSLAEALQAHGVDRRQAMLAAQIGMAAFVQATLTWFEEPQRSLPDHLDEAFRTLRLVAAPAGSEL